MLSWLAPEPISREIFTDHRAAVNELIDYSMIRWDAGTNMLQVHRLVQEISRSRIPADERSASLQAALHAINTAAPTAPDDVRPWPVWNLLRPHVSELIAHADQNGITDPTVRLMNDLGTLVQLAVAIPALAGFVRSGILCLAANAFAILLTWRTCSLRCTAKAFATAAGRIQSGQIKTITTYRSGASDSADFVGTWTKSCTGYSCAADCGEGYQLLDDGEDVVRDARKRAGEER